MTQGRYLILEYGAHANDSTNCAVELIRVLTKDAGGKVVVIDVDRGGHDQYRLSSAGVTHGASGAGPRTKSFTATEPGP